MFLDLILNSSMCFTVVFASQLLFILPTTSQLDWLSFTERYSGPRLGMDEKKTRDVKRYGWAPSCDNSCIGFFVGPFFPVVLFCSQSIAAIINCIHIFPKDMVASIHCHVFWNLFYIVSLFDCAVTLGALGWVKIKEVGWVDWSDTW